MARIPGIWVLVVAAVLTRFGGEPRAGEFEVWNYQCMQDETTEERVCTTEIATSMGDQDFLIYFVHNKRGSSPLVVTGEQQRFTGLTIKVDKEDPVEADVCEVGMCYFDAEKSSALLRQFRKGRRARVSIINENLDFILDTEITLRGFTASYAQH